MKAPFQPTNMPPYSNTIPVNDERFQQETFASDKLIPPSMTATRKRSFLAFTQNKYVAVPVENIAFFYSKNACSNLVCLDQKKYPINYSLDQIQQLLTGNQFFRANRQYLINFRVIREVEHYFARKLLVKLSIGTEDLLLVPKEKARMFLHWLENG